MINEKGWWCPFQDRRDTVRILMKQRLHVPGVVSMLSKRRNCLQAGGNVGIYPFELSKHFQTVTTVEMDVDNGDCLRRNLEDRNVENVRMWTGTALGRDAGECGEDKDDLNIGKHRVVLEGTGTPMTSIDGMRLEDIDLIWLDIEGMEKPALEGAFNTIERDKPWIAIEENVRAKVFLDYDPEPASEYLERVHKYVKVADMDRDILFKPPE